MATADHARHNARTYAAREIVIALIAVLALHAALALWLLRERPARVGHREAPRTIVARLLSAPPAPAVTMTPRAAAVPVPAHTPPQPREMPKTGRKIAAPPQPGTLSRPEEAVVPAPPSPSPGGMPTIAPPAAPTTAEPAAQPQTMSAPKPVSHVDCHIAPPDYPEAARRRGETGTAVVRFVVGVDGRVESAQLLRSSGHARLDDAALDALKGSTCRPSLDAGVPVRVVFEQTFVFGLDN